MISHKPAPNLHVFPIITEALHPLVDSISKNLAGAFRLRDVVYPNQINEPEIEKKVPLYFPDSAEPFPFKMAGNFPIHKLPTDNPLI